MKLFYVVSCLYVFFFTVPTQRERRADIFKYCSLLEKVQLECFISVEKLVSVLKPRLKFLSPDPEEYFRVLFRSYRRKISSVIDDVTAWIRTRGHIGIFKSDRKPEQQRREGLNLQLLSCHGRQSLLQISDLTTESAPRQSVKPLCADLRGCRSVPGQLVIHLKVSLLVQIPAEDQQRSKQPEDELAESWGFWMRVIVCRCLQFYPSSISLGCQETRSRLKGGSVLRQFRRAASFGCQQRFTQSLF